MDRRLKAEEAGGEVEDIRGLKVEEGKEGGRHLYWADDRDVYHERGRRPK